jgi:hypothetical protein
MFCFTILELSLVLIVRSPNPITDNIYEQPIIPTKMQRTENCKVWREEKFKFSDFLIASLFVILIMIND